MTAGRVRAQRHVKAEVAVERTEWNAKDSKSAKVEKGSFTAEYAEGAEEGRTRSVSEGPFTTEEPFTTGDTE